jgi:hypothetical protein
MKNIVRLMAATMLLGVAASPASASPVSFTFLDAAMGNLTAHFTVDVVGGLAVSGTGTITSSLASFSGNTYDLLLLTASSGPLGAGNGSINPTPGTPPYDNGSGFTWHGVTGSGGADFLVDAVVNSSANYLDDYGLAFAMIDHTTSAWVGGFNPWANTNDPGSLYTENIGLAGGAAWSYPRGSGTLTVDSIDIRSAAVPEPATLSLLGLGLLGLGARLRTRKK